MAKLWKKIGAGSFQIAYLLVDDQGQPVVNQKGQQVIKKVRIHNSDPTDTTERHLRLMSEINPTLDAAEDTDSDLGTGWIMPCLPVEADSTDDAAVSRKILEIYRNTRRIIVDGCGAGNFRKADDKGDVIAADLGLALNRDLSTISRNYWQRTGFQFAKYWRDHEDTQPRTVNMIRTLVWLEDQMGASRVRNEDLDYPLLMILAPSAKLNLRMTADDFQTINRIYQDYPQHLTKASCSAMLSTTTVRTVWRTLEKCPAVIASIKKHLPVSLDSLQENNIRNNLNLLKALIAATEYLDSGKFKWYHRHGSNGKNQTKEFIKRLLQLPDYTEQSIKAEMKLWLQGKGFFDRSSNADTFSRSRYAHESGFFGTCSTAKFAEANKTTRQSALRMMLL